LDSITSVTHREPAKSDMKKIGGVIIFARSACDRAFITYNGDRGRDRAISVRSRGGIHRLAIDDVEAAKEEIERAIEGGLGRCGACFFWTDMVSARHAYEHRGDVSQGMGEVEIPSTGVNLPMVIRTCIAQQGDIARRARHTRWRTRVRNRSPRAGMLLGAASQAEEGWPERRVTLINELGLHARAAAQVVRAAAGFKSRITLKLRGSKCRGRRAFDPRYSLSCGRTRENMFRSRPRARTARAALETIEGLFKTRLWRDCSN